MSVFKKRGAGDEEQSAKEQVAELQELIGTAREDGRSALSRERDVRGVLGPDG